MSETHPYELELKLALEDETAWHRVHAALASVRVEDQVNVFFDRADHALQDRRIGVRMRQAGDRCGLTVKRDPANGSAAPSTLTRRLELEAPVSDADFDSARRDGLDLRPWLASWRAEYTATAGTDPQLVALLDELSTLCEARLSVIGGFENERTHGRLALDTAAERASIEIELDRTRFPGGRTDYEIEIELPPDSPATEVETVRRALTDRLDSLQVRTAPAESKLARFLAIRAAD